MQQSGEIPSAVHFDETQRDAGGLHKEELMGEGGVGQAGGHRGLQSESDMTQSAKCSLIVITIMDF